LIQLLLSEKEIRNDDFFSSLLESITKHSTCPPFRRCSTPAGGPGRSLKKTVLSTSRV